MPKLVSLLAGWLLVITVMTGQDGLNQIIVVNGGQFGNPGERTNLAVYDPVSEAYQVFDTLPANSVQHLVVSGDTAYVAAQEFLAMYDLDSYERLALVPFPGVSAHQLLLWGDHLFATNFYGQAANNLYAFDRRTLQVTDTVPEIAHPGGTLALGAGRLYVSQNRKGSTDACPPFGCFNDTLGYLAVVDPVTRLWVEDIALENQGNECGRILNNNGVLVSLNDLSGTATAYQIATGASLTQPLPLPPTTQRYRNEAEVIGGRVVALFDGGIGALSEDLQSVDVLVDTPVVAFAYDATGDRFFATFTDFFSTDAGYAFDASGVFTGNFPVGFAPEAIAVHYNRQPVGGDLEVVSADTILLNATDVAFDPDGDDLVASRVVEAPANGLLSLLPGGQFRYVSLSPGSADAFRVEICDVKRNPLCSFIGVTVLPATGVSLSELFTPKAYPNPSSDRVIVAGWPEGFRASLYNGMGAVVRAGLFGPEVDLSALPRATYYLRFARGGESLTLPLVKW